MKERKGKKSEDRKSNVTMRGSERIRNSADLTDIDPAN